MSKTLDEIRMLDILPPNLLNDEKIVAAAEALDSELKKIHSMLKLLVLIVVFLSLFYLQKMFLTCLPGNGM